MTDTAHVLVVDDDPDLRDELQEYLTGHGFRMSTAEGGAAMHAVLEQEPVDLVIMDLKMPGESGLSLTSSIRKTSKAGVIILTGTGDDVDRVVGLEIGADDYLAKPCNLRELLARVRSVLRRTRGDGGRGLEVEEVEAERELFQRPLQRLRIMGINALGVLHRHRADLLAILRQGGSVDVLLLDPNGEAFRKQRDSEEKRNGRRWAVRR